MPKIKKNIAEIEDSNVISPEQQLKSYLNKTKDYHFNFQKRIRYKISTSSLSLDLEMGGGLDNGISMLFGEAESGKSSFSLCVMNNFLNTMKDGRGLYILAEGRDEFIRRSGIKIAEDVESWTDGTCFILRTQIYEVALQLIRDLINNNPLSKKYFIVIDSIHALVAKSELEKTFEDSLQVASGAVLATHFLRTMSLPINEQGHTCLILNQKRASIQINRYQKADPKIVDTSASNAQLHFSTWILEFCHKWKDDYIYADAKSGTEDKKIIGHNCIIQFRKTPNEKTNVKVKYPVLYNRKIWESVYVEQEIVNQLLSWDMLKRNSDKGAWFYLTPTLYNELKEMDKDIPDKFQGEEQICKYLHSKPSVTKYLYNKFANIVKA